MAQRDPRKPIPTPQRDTDHRAPQMQEYNRVEGDNLPQAAQETTPRNFLCFHVLSHF